MASFKTIDDLDNLSGQRVLIRADLNVPMQNGHVTDDTRIQAVIPTITDLLAKGATVILLSHFGRPKGERNEDMSLRPLQGPLSAAIGQAVAFGDDCIGEAAETAIKKAQARIVLLENLRFHKGEETNDPTFAEKLAALGDIYINDAFSAAHRAHASTDGITRFLPSYAGRSMQSELEALDAALGNPTHPVTAIVGGAKVSTKLAVLENLVSKVDHLIIGGGMANTFLAAQGINTGASLCEHDLKETALRILNAAREKGCQIHLPTDGVLAKEFKAGAQNRITSVHDIQSDEMMLDVGPQSVSSLEGVLADSKTLIWNGPMGAFEIEPFDKATVTLAQKAAALTDSGNLISVAGGGDTVAALAHAGVKDQFTHVSTAGGAFLEWMEGKELPGVAALQKSA